MMFVTTVRESLYFQYISNELLLAAATVISLIGASYLAWAKEEASNISSNVKTEWNYLDPRSAFHWPCWFGHDGNHRKEYK
jgi:hypothetical protein